MNQKTRNDLRNEFIKILIQKSKELESTPWYKLFRRYELRRDIESAKSLAYRYRNNPNY
jgi:hypothetical protein